MFVSASHELSQGSGLYNFFRQLGGSFGIAVIATLLNRSIDSYGLIIFGIGAAVVGIQGRDQVRSDLARIIDDAKAMLVS